MEQHTHLVPKKVEENLAHAIFYGLNRGEELFRFANTRAVPFFGYHASSWWLREREFNLVLNRAGASSLGLMQARFDLAVLQGWSKMDVLVRASVLRNL